MQISYSAGMNKLAKLFRTLRYLRREQLVGQAREILRHKFVNPARFAARALLCMGAR